MSGACAAPQAPGFVGEIMGFIDCQAESLGTSGWQALAAPGSSFSLALTGLLTVFVAFAGYQLLLGYQFTVREAVLGMVKIGIVLTLATSWPAYQTLVYNVAVDGPGEIVATIGQRPPGAAGAQLLERLDLADKSLTRLGILGAGVPAPDQQAEVPPSPFGGFDAFALGGGRILFLLTALGALATVRVITGLMLALGPIFIAFLLFDGTRSVFEGWVRVLAGAALAAVGSAVALGLELAFLEPWLASVIARRSAGEALPMVGTEAFVIVALGSLMLLTTLWASGRAASAFRLAPVLARTGFSNPLLPDHQAAEPRARLAVISHGPSRAEAVAGSLVTQSRRELRDPLGGGPLIASAGGFSTVASQRAGGRATVLAVGRTFPRRTRQRVSASAERRDQHA